MAEHYKSDPRLWRDIADPNNINNPKKLKPGQVLILKTPEPIFAYITALHGDVRGDLPVTEAVKPSQGHRASKLTATQYDAPLQLGQALPVGTVLRTGRGSFVTLSLTMPSALSAPTLSAAANAAPDTSKLNGHLVTLPSQSNLRIASLQDKTGKPAVVLELVKGQVDSRVKPLRDQSERYEIRTRMATVLVRGTYFRVTSDGENTMTTGVLEGQVLEKPVQTNATDLLLANAHGSVRTGDSAVVQAQSMLSSPVWAPIEPGEEAQNQPKVFLQWQKLPATLEGKLPASYRLQLARDALFTDIVAQEDVPHLEAQSNSTDSSNLKSAMIADVPKGNYYARVSAVAPDGLEGLFSTTRFVRSSYDLDAQMQQSKPSEKAVTFRWNALPKSVYTLTLSQERDMQNPALKLSGLTVNTVNLSLPPGQYFWRVEATINALGQTSHLQSEPQALSVAPLY